jgi:hypothetical protein
MQNSFCRFLKFAVFALALSLLPIATVYGKDVEGGCDTTSTKSEDCQYEPLSYTAAPAVSISKGIRLKSGAQYILFNNWPAIGPRFVSNDSGNNYFVPQATQNEFQRFLDASVLGVSSGYAVAPQQYIAYPQGFASCSTGVWSPAMSSPINVPSTNSSTSPVIVSSYMLVLNPSNPGSTTTSVGSTERGKSPAEFSYARQDCSTDNQGTKKCRSVSFVQDQLLSFLANGKAPSFSWSSPGISARLYVSQDGGDYAAVADCSGNYAPKIDGACGSANGEKYSSAPTSGLCSTGNATSPTGSSSSWSWICQGVNGGANQSCATATNCNLPWGGSVSVGDEVTAYEASAASGGGSCNSETRVCQSNGTLSGSFTYQNCVDKGACGAANGKSFSSAPTADLCASGTASPVTALSDVCPGYTYYSGICLGSGGCTIYTVPQGYRTCGYQNRSSCWECVVSYPGCYGCEQYHCCNPGFMGWSWTCTGAAGTDPAKCSAY